MNATSHIVPSSFFKQASINDAPLVLKAERNAVMITTEKAGGMHAAAVVMINHFLTGAVHEALFQQLFKRHFAYFPRYRFPLAGFDVATIATQPLFATRHLPALIYAFAHTLRQIAIDELLTNPICYRHAFAGVCAETTRDMLRESTDWADEDLFAALANALDLSIEMRITQFDHELPLRHTYHRNSQHGRIMMQRINGQYVVEVAQSAWFRGLNAFTPPPLQPTLTQDKRAVDDILARIAEEEQRYRAIFAETKRRLATMVLAGELTKNDLITLYVDGIATHATLPDRVDETRIGQRYSDLMWQAEQELKGSGGQSSYDHQIMRNLIDGIAKEVSLGHIALEALFAHAEQKMRMVM